MSPRRANTVKNPCGFDESFAWVSPQGEFFYLRNGGTHLDWAARWVLEHLPLKDIPWTELLASDPFVKSIDDFDPLALSNLQWTRDIISEWSFKHLIANGWVRVVNAVAFQAKGLQNHPVQAEAVLSVILQGIRSGCVKPDSDMWYADFIDTEGPERKYSVVQFVRWIGGKKAEEQIYEIALSKMASRVASNFIQRSPCKADESFAWIAPNGELHLLSNVGGAGSSFVGQTHTNWAGRWVFEHVKDIPYKEILKDFDPDIMGDSEEFDPLDDEGMTIDILEDWAFGYLLKNGWVRVVNATAFQAKGLPQLSSQAVEKVVEIILQGVRDKCIGPYTEIWYMDSIGREGPDKRYTAEAFARWLGGKKAEEQFYTLMEERESKRKHRLASRVADTFLQRNPCKKIESFAWLSPKGQFYYLRNEKTHMDWAAEWVYAHVRDIPWADVLQVYKGGQRLRAKALAAAGSFDPEENKGITLDILRYWAFDYLITAGWIRVVSATAFQAKDLDTSPQVGEVLKVIMQGVEDGCVVPGTRIWYVDGASDDAPDRGMPAAEFVRWLGGRKAEDLLFERAMHKTAAVPNPCGDDLTGYAWISPDGEMHYGNHLATATRWLQEHEPSTISQIYASKKGTESERRRDTKYEIRDLFLKRGWVRVTNANNFQAVNLKPSSPAAKSVIDIILAGVPRHCVTPESTVYLAGAHQDGKIYSAADIIRWLGGRKAENQLFDLAMQKTAGGKTPCVRESFAWLSPAGDLHYLATDQTHYEWAFQWLKQEDPEFNMLTGEDRGDTWAFKALLTRGWVRVVNATAFEADDLQAHVQQVKALLNIFFQGVSEGCITTATDIYVEQHKGGDRTFAAEDFARWLGGRKAEDNFYALLAERTQRIMRNATLATRTGSLKMARRIADTILKNPCHVKASYAWISPTGDIHYLANGDIHMGWAGKWLEKNDPAAFASIRSSVEALHHFPAQTDHETSRRCLWALLEQGWVRVANAQNYQAYDLRPGTTQADRVVDIILAGIGKGCLSPESKMFLAMSSDGVGRTREYTAGDFARWLGGRKAEESLYEIAMAPVMRVAHRNPCHVNESYAWIHPTGQISYLKPGVPHTNWAAAWVLANVRDIPYPTILQDVEYLLEGSQYREFFQQLKTDFGRHWALHFDPTADQKMTEAVLGADWAYDYLLKNGWVRVSSINGFQAYDLQGSSTQVKQSVIQIIMEAAQAKCVLPETNIWLDAGTTIAPISKKYTAADFVKWLGGRGAEEELFAASMKTASSACDSATASYAWIDPHGGLHELGRGHHDDWAHDWLTKQRFLKGKPPKNRDTYDSTRTLLNAGWLRVVNFLNIQAKQEGRPAKAWETAAKVVADCLSGRVTEEVVQVDTDALFHQISIGDFIEQFGGRQLSEGAWSRLAQRIAQQHIVQGQ